MILRSAGRQQGDEALGDLGRQLLEQRRAVVGLHFVDERRDALVAEVGDEALLLLGVEVTQDLRRQIARQQAKDQGGLILLEAVDEIGDIGRVELQQRLAQLC